MKNFKSERLYIQVFNEIRKHIVKNNLTAGSKLPTEHELCEMLGVSRNVLREAINAMKIMGVLKSVPSKGIIIQEFNMDFLFQNMFYYLVVDSDDLIKEILEIKKVLELGYMQEAFDKVTSEEIEEMRKLVETMVEKSSRGQIFLEEDMKFHMLLFKNVNNRTLESIFAAAWNVDENFNTSEKIKHLDQFAEKHMRIVEALEKKDYEMFENTMRSHFAPNTYLINKGNETILKQVALK